MYKLVKNSVFGKMFKVLSSIKSFLIKNKSGIIVGIIASLIASLIFVFPQYISLPQEPSSDVVEKLLDFSENLIENFPEFNELIALLERKSKEEPKNMENWMVLGQMYASSNNYRKALYCYTRAYEIDPRIADPYYARGNVYYELALIDLFRKKRFSCDSEKLVCTLEPDEQSKILFRKVLDEYNQAERYQTLQDLYPTSGYMVTSLHIVGYRRSQINDFFEGSSTITLHRLELLRVLGWVAGIFPENKELMNETVKLSKNLFDYMAEHPEEFPYIITPPKNWKS